MKKIKFSADKGTLFYKELNEKVDLHFSNLKISKSGNAKMYSKIVFYFGLDILFFVLLMKSESVLQFYTYYLLLGLSVLLTAFNIAHDAAHGVAVKSKFWNEFLFQLSFNMLGINAYVWRKNHTESHHVYTNIEGSDTDILNNPLMRMSVHQPLKWFHRFQVFYVPILYLFYSLNSFLFRDSLLLLKILFKKVSVPTIEILKFIAFKFLYIVLILALPIIILPFDYSTVLLAFFIMHLMISFLFVFVLGLAHLSDYVGHPQVNDAGNLNISWASLQLQSCIDYHSESTFCNWTLGGFNTHAIHHLFPKVCHVHYLTIVPIVKELAKKKQLNYLEMPYHKSLFSHFRFLKKMGTQINYSPIKYTYEK